VKFGIQFQLQTPRPYDAETWGPDDEARIFAQALEQIEHADRLGKIFFSSEARKDVSGVVGSYEATRQSFEFDTTLAVRILALISLSLGVINLFPFLPLDGGHIFWALAEKIRGRPIPFAVLERASVIGIMLVGLLFVIGLSNDIGRITSGEGFGVR